ALAERSRTSVGSATLRTVLSRPMTSRLAQRTIRGHQLHSYGLSSIAPLQLRNATVPYRNIAGGGRAGKRVPAGMRAIQLALISGHASVADVEGVRYPCSQMKNEPCSISPPSPT